MKQFKFKKKTFDKFRTLREGNQIKWRVDLYRYDASTEKEVWSMHAFSNFSDVYAFIKNVEDSRIHLYRYVFYEQVWSKEGGIVSQKIVKIKDYPRSFAYEKILQEQEQKNEEEEKEDGETKDDVVEKDKCEAHEDINKCKKFSWLQNLKMEIFGRMIL